MYRKKRRSIEDLGGSCMRKKDVIPSVIAITVIGFGALGGCNNRQGNLRVNNNTQDQSVESDQAPQVQFDHKQFDVFSDVTPSARGCSNGGGVYFEGAAIYWKSGYDDLVIAGRVRTPSSGGPETMKLLKLQNDYSLGLKFGMGLDFKRDVWDTFANWTWLKTHHSDRREVSSFQFQTLLGAVYPQELVDNFANRVTSHWQFELNTIDFELGRNFFISKFINLRPFAGVKGGWITQQLKVIYGDVIDSNGIPFSTPIRTRFKDHMWCLGPRIGINTRWVLGRSNFALLANVAADLMWEDFQPSSQVSYLDGFGNQPSIGRVRQHIQDLTPVMEAMFGLDWGHCFGGVAYLNIAVGYEMQYWWDQYRAASAVNTNATDPLNLQGATGKIRLEF